MRSVNQIPLDKDTAKLTKFITPCGQYFYWRLPHKISSAPEIFKGTMEDILHDQQDHVICFFDDILVLSKSESEHTKHLKDTCIQLHNAGKKLNREKCESRNKELRFLSFIISKDGVKPDPQKTEAILHMPDQMDVPEHHHLLGMVTFLGRYMKDLSTTLLPVTKLQEKDRAWTRGLS